MNITEIRYDGAVIRGRPSPGHLEGLFLKKGGFLGWEGVTDARREQVARAVEHGEHDVPVYLGARVTTWDIWVVAHTESRLRLFSETLAGAAADGRRTKVAVDHQGQDLHAFGRRMVGVVEDQGFRHGRNLISSGQVQFVFADPRKYGTDVTFPAAGASTAVLAEHRGNFPAHPVIEIPSAPASWTVTSSAGTVQVVGAPAGGTHRFDMLTGRLTRNGVDVTSAIVRGDIWAIPRKQSMLHTLSAPGRVIVPPTFV